MLQGKSCSDSVLMRTLDVFKQVTLKCSRIQMSWGTQRCNDTSYHKGKLLCCLLKEPEALQEVPHFSNSISNIKLWKWSGIEIPVWLFRFSLLKVSLYSEEYLERQKIPLCFCILWYTEVTWISGLLEWPQDRAKIKWAFHLQNLHHAARGIAAFPKGVVSRHSLLSYRFIIPPHHTSCPAHGLGSSAHLMQYPTHLPNGYTFKNYSNDLK